MAEDGGVVGYCRFGPGRDQDVDRSRAAEVYGLYVHPDRWGRGIGGRLLATALRNLADRGFGEARLWVVEGNSRSRRFYEHMGFRLDGGGKPFHGAPQVRYRIDLEGGGSAEGRA